MRRLAECCNDRKNNLDFIRFVAATLVIYSHAFPISNEVIHDQLAVATNGAWYIGILCVACFFVISGFLIAQSYDRSNDPAKFIKARLLRILPGFILVIVLSTFVLGPIITTLPLREYFTHPQTWQYLKSVFMFPLYWNLPGVFETNIYGGSVNGSLWTIPYEMFFYGVVLILGILGLLKKKKTGLVFYLLFMFLELFKTKIYPTGGYFMTLPRYDFIELGLFFSSGMLLYTYREHIVLDKHYAMLSLLVLTIFGAMGHFVVPFSIFGAYLILYAAYSEKAIFKNFSKYGDFSYGIYIYGWPVQQIVTYCFGGSMNPYVNTAISLVVTLILAVFSWHFVEKPCMALRKRRLIPNWKVFRAIGDVLKKCIQYIQTVVAAICNISWIAFLVVLCVGGIAIKTIYAIHSVAIMSEAKEHIFAEGWYEKNDTEASRWVSKESVIYLESTDSSNGFVLEGYIPESFTEISQLTIYFNEQQVYEETVTPGALISIKERMDVSSGRVAVKMVFDGEHVPDTDTADQRSLSAQISCIGFVDVEIPSLITFPYEEEKLFQEGWLPQNEEENNCWVEQESTLWLNCPEEAKLFVLEGYVPENFTEVGYITVYLGEQIIYEGSVQAGESISIQEEIQGMNDCIQARIVFDNEHVPDEMDVDQRIMSAMITKIGFEP